MKIPKIIPMVLFAGSIFLTSGKFVNETNTPKFYFVVVILLVASVVTVIHKKQINLGVFSSKTILWGINVICFLQACYGLSQFVGWFPSDHSRYTVAGSFDNPAGFAAVLSMGFPIGLLLLTKARRVEKYLASATLAAIVIAVFFSGSRAGMLAIIASSVVFLIFQPNAISKLRQLTHRKLLAVLIVACFASGAFILYNQKKDSSNGRLLIWKVSTEMIKDKPFWGHGYGAFQARYMDYQAEYFKNNPNSAYSQLADNVKRPFNEFIKVTVEFGLTGLTVALLIILFVFLKIVKSENKYRGLVLSGLASFFVYTCFSYPLYYVAVWLLLAFYLFTLLPSKEIKIRNAPILIITRTVIVLACAFFLCHVYKQIRAEIKWKTIAVSSLRGSTEIMLPEYEKLHSTPLKRVLTLIK